MEDVISKILKTTNTIAVVGLSPQSHKPSHWVPAYLQQHGFKIIPIYPKGDKILGERVYRQLSDIKEPIDLVLIFRRSDKVMPFVKEAIEKGIKAIWLQEGIYNEEAAALAQQHNVMFVMDRCMYKEHRRLM